MGAKPTIGYLIILNAAMIHSSKKDKLKPEHHVVAYLLYARVPVVSAEKIVVQYWSEPITT